MTKNSFQFGQKMSKTKVWKRHPLMTGTLILTSAGFLSRIMGFFNRIYLSKLIGPKEMGIYQLIFPLYLIAFSCCCHGTELAVSQMIARCGGKKANNGPTISIRKDTGLIVRSAAFLSISCALVISLCFYFYADFISEFILKTPECALCIRLMAPVLPFTALRSCLHGYYIGQKKTFVPAAGQLIEQGVRIFFIWLVASSYGNSMTFTANLAVCGMVIGEIAETVYVWLSYKAEDHPAAKRSTIESPASPKRTLRSSCFSRILECKRTIRELLKGILPLTGSKLCFTLAASLESVLIPLMLAKYYENKSIALSMYGILTGMALPFITFPSALTNSLSILLLPAVSEAHSAGKREELLTTIKKTVTLCFSLGVSAFLFFFLTGKRLGFYVFANEDAGEFLYRLSFLCPFLYASSSGASILNGLGLMKQSLLYNLISMGIRIGFIVCSVPSAGIPGYLTGLMSAYLTLVLLQMSAIWKFFLSRTGHLS